ncbi:MAG: TrmH family RNA methyltransferase, partial [Flavobacteriales bacterium]
KESGLKILAVSEYASKKIHECETQTPTALILGAEDTGINKGLLNMADEEASIPLSGEVGSLNVSVAAGVALYEVKRGRGLEE